MVVPDNNIILCIKCICKMPVVVLPAVTDDGNERIINETKQQGFNTQI